MRFSEIASRLTGTSTPLFGACRENRRRLALTQPAAHGALTRRSSVALADRIDATSRARSSRSR